MRIDSGTLYLRNGSASQSPVAGISLTATSGGLVPFAHGVNETEIFDRADLSERLVLKTADAVAVFGNDVAISAELVLVGR